MDKKIQKIVASGILVNKRGEVLLAQRPKHKTVAPGMYHLPGGHIEFGETPEQALVREFLEEFQLHVAPSEVVRTFSYTAPENHTVGITFLVTSGDPLEYISFDSHDTESVVWVNRSQIGAYLKPSDHDYITLIKFFKE